MTSGRNFQYSFQRKTNSFYFNKLLHPLLGQNKKQTSNMLRNTAGDGEQHSFEMENGNILICEIDVIKTHNSYQFDLDEVSLHFFFFRG